MSAGPAPRSAARLSRAARAAQRGGARARHRDQPAARGFGGAAPAPALAALAAASLVQTIPGLALLALFYPLLLALSALTTRVFGFAVPALGFLPSLLALTLYSMLPILRNAVAGLVGVDPGYIEAADGVGMTPGQRLLRVELPLAAPVIMAGIRTAAVWTIGTATLSTPVGQTSLGNYIFSGLQTENWVSVLFGCVAAVALALFVDQVLGLIEVGVADATAVASWPASSRSSSRPPLRPGRWSPAAVPTTSSARRTSPSNTSWPT